MTLSEDPDFSVLDPEAEGPGSDEEAAAPAPAAFPEARGRQKGYEKRAVDAFLARARDAFEQDEPTDPDTPRVTSATIRAAAFPLTRHGYSIAAVDAGLGRIEDAFAVRERARAIDALGAPAFVAHSRSEAQVVLDRLTRARRRRFDRVPAYRYGYRIEEVDLVADKLSRYLAKGEPVTIEQVRGVAFRMQRGGYREAQVDAVLDAVVEIILAVG